MVKKLFALFFLSALLFPKYATAHLIPTVTHHVRLEYFEDKILYSIKYTYDPVIVHRFLPTFDTNSDRNISKEEQETWIKKYISRVSVKLNGELQELKQSNYTFPLYSDFINSTGNVVVNGEIAADLSCSDRVNIEVHDGNAFLSPQDDVYNYAHLGNDCVRAAGIESHEQSSNAVVGDVNGLQVNTGDQKQPGVVGSIQGIKNILTNPNPGNTVYALALGIAVLVGALHALTPGHGKTLVAAYLVGQKGTVKDALILAGVTTLTHTLSIYILGFMALFATQYFYPEKIIPVLEAISALSIFGIGIWLLVRRYGEFKKSKELNEDGDEVVHSHDGGIPHSHGLADLKGKRLTLASLVSLGFSGGIVPCVDALAIMILSISLNQIVFGMILILFFSLGLAGVLVILGVLLVTSKRLVEKKLPFDSISRYAPLVSSIVIVLLGIYLTLRALKIGI